MNFSYSTLFNVPTRVIVRILPLHFAHKKQNGGIEEMYKVS